MGYVHVSIKVEGLLSAHGTEKGAIHLRTWRDFVTMVETLAENRTADIDIEITEVGG